MTRSSLKAPPLRPKSGNDHIAPAGALSPALPRRRGDERGRRQGHPQEPRILARSAARGPDWSWPTWMAAIFPERATKIATGSPGIP